MAILFQCDLFAEMDGFAGNRAINMNIWDWFGQWTGKTHRKQWPPQPQDVDDRMTLWNTHKMFSMYNDKQIIAPSWATHKQVIMNREMSAAMGDEWQEAVNLGFD